MPLAVLAAVPPCPHGVKWDTKMPTALKHQEKGQGDAFTSRAEAMLRCNRLQVSRDVSTMAGADPTQSL